MKIKAKLLSMMTIFVITFQGLPNITVEPTSLAATNQAPDDVIMQTFDISNVGEADLVGTIGEDTETRASRSAVSTVFLDQPPNQSKASFSDVDCNICNGGIGGTQVIAENFALVNSAVITQITFWGGYFPNNMAPVQDDLTVIFHADANNLPMTTLSIEPTAPYTRTTTGIILLSVNEYKYTITLSSPVVLDAGTYWVEIYNDTTGNMDSFFWEFGDLDAVNGIDGAAFAQQAPGAIWNAASNDFAIRIEGFETEVCVDPAEIPCPQIFYLPLFIGN